jgi:hypothetical protein
MNYVNPDDSDEVVAASALGRTDYNLGGTPANPTNPALPRKVPNLTL